MHQVVENDPLTLDLTPGRLASARCAAHSLPPLTQAPSPSPSPSPARSVAQATHPPSVSPDAREPPPTDRLTVRRPRADLDLTTREWPPALLHSARRPAA